MRRALVLTVALAVPIFLPLPAAVAATGPRGGADVVKIKTSDEVTLEASFLKPARAHSPGVIVLHDASSNRSQLDVFAQRLNKEGFGVLSVDLRGHGGSKADKLDWSMLSDADKKAIWANAPRDVDAAAEWLGKQANILPTSLSIVACGSGCALALRHAKGNENVMCMALLAPNERDYGFDVRAELQPLAGLPTVVAAAKNSAAEHLALEANASSDKPYVEIFLSQAKLTNPLEDKTLPSKVTTWLSEKCLPKKGR